MAIKIEDRFKVAVKKTNNDTEAFLLLFDMLFKKAEALDEWKHKIEQKGRTE